MNGLDMFGIQADVSGKAQILAFSRFIYKAEIIEQLLSCVELVKEHCFDRCQYLLNIIKGHICICHKFF